MSVLTCSARDRDLIPLRIGKKLCIVDSNFVFGHDVKCEDPKQRRVNAKNTCIVTSRQ